MNGKPEGYISTSAPIDARMIDNMHRHQAFTRLNHHLIPEIMQELGLYGKANVGGIVQREGFDDAWTVVVKVITPAGSVLVSEDWTVFPSDEFKTKLLMACA